MSSSLNYGQMGAIIFTNETTNEVELVDLNMCRKNLKKEYQNYFYNNKQFVTWKHLRDNYKISYKALWFLMTIKLGVTMSLSKLSNYNDKLEKMSSDVDDFWFSICKSKNEKV